MPTGASRAQTGAMTQQRIPAGGDVRPTTPSRLAWLEEEVTLWRAGGIVDDAQARAILSRYAAARRFSLARLLLFVGGAFLSVGLLWLVASNLDAMSPSLRFVVVTSLWLAFLVGAEVLAGRNGHRSLDGETAGSPVVGALRLVAALSFGAVVFQAAQTLQVPAYAPSLVGVWGLGALLHAYAVHGVAPLLVGVSATAGWYVWEVFERAQDGLGFVLPVLLAAVVAGAVAAIHGGSRWPSFASSWREASALLALVGLFVAAFPYVDVDRFVWSPPVVAGAVVAAAAVAASVVLTTGWERLEALVPVLAVVAGVLLVLWESPEPVHGSVAAEGYVHAFVSVAVYLVAAGWYAVLGVLRDSDRLTFIATGALVVFTTVQSFAVFAPIVTGATLFLVLGVVLLGSGYLFDRGRRHLVGNLEGVTA
jgi:uncharacterized membrane protein